VKPPLEKLFFTGILAGWKKVCNFAATESATLLVERPANQGGSFIFSPWDSFIPNSQSAFRKVQRSKEEFIKEHFIKYDKPEFPPAWKTLELASFGTLSKLYYNFADNKVKKRVAREFNPRSSEFAIRKA